MDNTEFEIGTCKECQRESMELVDDICLDCWDEYEAERKTFDNS